MKYKITLVGSGNVATHLAQAFDNAGHTINQVISRDIGRARILASRFGAFYGDKPSTMYKDADFVILCVSDEAYFSVLDDLPSSMNAIICHTSGPVSINVLKGYATNYGVFYPLQSFRKEEVKSMLEVPVFIEYNNDMTRQKLHDLADSITNKVREVDSAQREKYHLAAVFANNFTNAMYSVAEEYLESNGLEFDHLLPIIAETANRLKQGKPSQWQTGPAKRGDNSVIQKHLDMLTNDQLRGIYEQISEYIARKAKNKLYDVP